ncbi:peptidoglycan-binding domain-containing protein [Isoptericola luteus]|uniref:peptidoglycan-binding domain-containing protein n=1 Tax=Isoptericola luteus TaxID=2879484 RepID=UPI001CE06336|nr:peptidoglycan-binding domain-containing protein [Isoptericola sp. NEAU-Y5]
MTRRPWRVVVLAVVVALGVGAGVTWAVAPAPTPSWVQPTVTDAAQVEVSARDFAGERSVPVTAALSEQRELLLPDGGVLRETACAVGEAIESGSAPFLVDDHRVLALHTSTPLWRDLGVGIRGDDVRAVQEELTRLGHEVEATGYYGAGTAAAMSQVWVDATGEEKVTSLALSRVVWLPDREVVAAGCPLQVGPSPRGRSPWWRAGA